ncbi:fibropellin-3-like [Lytechinus variegatus]|uniref:fibropellin-3-like n=1 Tax=Lytechinus variegatus TaxID=7654 RepID=UPI001BB201BE|nr:fibropellin-3-like [Lytechinus variegatus]
MFLDIACIDDCTPTSCANNGFCVDGDNSFTCVCSHGFTGDTCTASICGSIACENGGVCSSSDQCTCAAGFIGSTCETNINECSPEPCRNGGTCIDGINSYTCSCRTGYTGNICDQDVDECALDSSLCANGRCVNTLVGLHTCVCNSGYTLTNSDSCAALSGTLFTSSLRVELTGQTLDGVLLTYTNSLANRLSDEFMEYDTTFCFLFSEYVRASLQNRRYQLLGDSCEVIGFRQGSIIADISFQVTAATQSLADDLALAVADLSTDIPRSLSTNGQSLLAVFTANVQCDQSNCRNGGTCTNAAQHCNCPSGFSGAFCQNVSSSQGLSLAATIGIAVGVPFFVFVIISCACCMLTLHYRQQSQARKMMMTDEYNNQPGFYGKRAFDSYSDNGSYDGRRQAIDRMRVNGASVQWNPRLAEDRRHFSTPYVVDGRIPERRVDRNAIVY